MPLFNKGKPKTPTIPEIQAPPPLPEPEPPVAQPDPDDPLLRRRKQRAAAERQSGRLSTIMSDSGRETFG